MTTSASTLVPLWSQQTKVSIALLASIVTPYIGFYRTTQEIDVRICFSFIQWTNV
jgi:hypothetical protein